MRLSRLSDRQLRRLIRNADVRFGDYRDRDEAIKIFDELYRLANSFIDKYSRNSSKLAKAVEGTVLQDKLREFADRWEKAMWAMRYIRQQLEKMNK